MGVDYNMINNKKQGQQQMNIKMFFIAIAIILIMIIAAKPVYIAIKAIIKSISG